MSRPAQTRGSSTLVSMPVPTSEFWDGIIETALNSDFGGTISSDGKFSPYTNDGEAKQAGVNYNNAHNSWGNTCFPGGARVKRNRGTRFSRNGMYQYTDGSGNLYTERPVFYTYEPNLAQSNGLFQPVDLSGSNVYLQLLKGLSYAYHYTRKNLPDEEMKRWRKKGLTIKDIFDFRSASTNPIFKIDAWGRFWATFAGKSAKVDLMINPDGAIEIYDIGSIPGKSDQIAVWMEELRHPETNEVVFEDIYLLTLDYNNYFIWYNKALKLIQSNLWNRDF